MYSDFIKKTTSTKKVIFQLASLLNVKDSIWVKQTNHIWVLTYSYSLIAPPSYNSNYGNGFYGYLNYGGSVSGGVLPNPKRPEVLEISSMLGDGVPLTELNSYADLSSNYDAFYWDTDNQLLYISTLSGKSPRHNWQALAAGVTTTFANIAGYYGDAYYDSRIVSAPSVSTKRDSLYYGKISYEGGTISLDNTDGYFDDFTSEEYNGAEVNLFFGGDDLNITDYEPIYSGYVDGFKFDNDTIDISFSDSRKKLSETVPANYYDEDAYPSIDDDVVGSVISLGYGVIRKATAVHIGLNVFKFVDTSLRAIQSIDAVYKDNVEISFSDANLNEGTFYISSYEDSEVISVSFHGYLKDDGVTLMDNPVDIIQDLITSYTTISYSDYFFNTMNWEEARNSTSLKCAIFIDESTEIIDVIEQISSSVLGSLIVNGEGKFDFNFRDETKNIKKQIEYNEYLESISVDSGSDNYLNSVKMGYSYSKALDSYIYYNNETLKQELYNSFRINKEQEFLTVLSDISDVELMATSVLDSFGGMFPIYTFTTKTQNIDLVVGDNVAINAKLRHSSVDNYIKCEVISKSLNLDDFECEFEVKYIESFTPVSGDAMIFDDGTPMLFDDGDYLSYDYETIQNRMLFDDGDYLMFDDGSVMMFDEEYI